MRKTIQVLALFAFLAAGVSAGAQASGAAPGASGAAPGASGAPAGMTAGLDFTVRFFDKKIYFLGDPIMIEATVTNTSADQTTFNVADNRVFSLDFDVRTPTNIPVEHAREFITERNSDQPVFFRPVTLQPGEKYSFVVDLDKYAAFTEAGLLIVQGLFYPELWRNTTSAVIRSNRLTLDLKPPVVTEEMRAVVEAQTGALISRQPLPPDQVVSYTVTARQKSQWDKFFLYLDLESLLRKSPDKDAAWRKASQQQQQSMLAQFRQQLMAARISNDISVIPTSFEIQKTSYTASQGTVQVKEKFAYTDFTEVKQYTYYLKKQDDSWIIFDYEIKNQGTE